MRSQQLLSKPTPPTALGQVTRYLVGSSRVTCRSKQLKSFRSEIQDGCHLKKLYFASSPGPKGQLTPNHGRHLENIFFASSPEPKGQLTPSLLGSIGMTCRSKIAKILPIGNPKWPPQQPYWKSIFRFFSYTQKPVDSKHGTKHWDDL